MAHKNKRNQKELDPLALERERVRTFRTALRQSVEAFSQDPDAGLKMMQIRADCFERNLRDARKEAARQAKMAHLRYR